MLKSFHSTHLEHAKEYQKRIWLEIDAHFDIFDHDSFQSIRVYLRGDNTPEQRGPDLYTCQIRVHGKQTGVVFVKHTDTDPLKAAHLAIERIQKVLLKEKKKKQDYSKYRRAS